MILLKGFYQKLILLPYIYYKSEIFIYLPYPTHYHERNNNNLEMS